MNIDTAIDIDAYIKQKAAKVEQRLNSLIPAEGFLFSAARYSLIGAGKRLRPVLAIATAETFGKCEDHVMTAACAIEMIHTYSLIHDDLPCMDDDDFRRGKPTLHKAFDEATAVLAGDYLLTFAFEAITNDSFLNDSQKLAIIRLLSRRAGGNGMIGGQIMDIQAGGIPVDIEQLKEIYCKKTGDLMIASLLSGALAANATNQEIEVLTHFGRDLGLAFQIIDDVIDVIDSEGKHGKKEGSDIINNKTTYVTLVGVDTAKKIAYDLHHQSLSFLDKIQQDTTLLRELANKLVCRKI